MPEVDQRDKIRQAEERRFACQQTLATIKEMVLTFKPTELVSAGEVGADKAIQPQEYTSSFRDWMNWVKDTFQEVKPLVSNILKDTLSLYALAEGTPEGE